MGLLDRFKRTGAGQPSGVQRSADVDRRHLEEFVATRTGVEAYIEPRTTVTGVTVLMVAVDGEWTRRSVPSFDWVIAFGKKQGIPVYDAAVTGTPARVREYNRRRKQAELGQLDEL